MNYIDIEKDKIPYQFEINLKNETFQFFVTYNGTGDFFVIDLYKNHQPVVFGEKVVYGVPLFENISYLDVPKVIIYPFDTTMGQTLKVSYNNLGEDVFLYVLD